MMRTRERSVDEPGFAGRGSAAARLGGAALCAAIAASALGCGVEAPDDAIEREAEGQAITACATATAGVWTNQAFAAQAGRFHVDVDVTPTTTAVDAVVGLSASAASTFPQLAAIVRFNASGTIDVRDGATYRADGFARSYTANTTYHLRFDVDTRNHRYSVWLSTGFGLTALARNYAFRTEQAAVASLANLATEVDAATGSLTSCDGAMVADATTADGCVIADAGAGFITLTQPTATVLDTVTFTATPSVAGIDAVVGVSPAAPTNFNGFAAAVRFSTANVLDVYDGTGYRADAAVSYSAGAAVPFRLVADIPSHRYSVVEGTALFAVRLANQYAFRASQASATQLSRISAIVDGPAGSLTLCPSSTPSTNAVYSRGGNYAVLPLAGNAALISDGATTQVVNAAGQTTSTIANGGALGGDADHFAIAKNASGALVVDAYDHFASAWHASVAVSSTARVATLAADASNTVRVATLDGGNAIIYTFDATGALASTFTLASEAVALDGAQVLTTWQSGGLIFVASFTSSGPTWIRVFSGSAILSAIAADGAHGVVLAGELFSPIDFGGGTLPKPPTGENGPANAFIVKLAGADGAHVFSRRTGTTLIGGLAANSARIALSTTWRTQFRYHELQLFDLAGTPIGGTSPEQALGLGENGVARAVALSSTGRAWWNIDSLWPYIPAWPYLIALNAP